jgi:soluble lytic murein transglycosylase-like protein
MKTLKLIAVALAAGMTTFAVQAHEAPRNGGKLMAEALAAAKENEPAAKKAKVRKPAKKTAASKTRHRKKLVAHASKHSSGSKVDRMTTASTGGKEKASEASRANSTANIAGSPDAYREIVDRYAKEYGVAPSLAEAVIQVESGYNPHRTGLAGEVGLMQIKPSTARMLGYSGSVKQLYSPETNIKWGIKYLAMAQDVGNGTTCGTLLKYNAGHAATHMNPVSAAYCGRVEAALADAAT